MKKILIVEDDEMENRLYQRVFSAAGFDVYQLKNGEECRAAVIYFHPDIILLDILMPKMNGLDTLDVLRFDSDTRSIPVVMLTNLADSTHEKDALRRGAAAYIVKSNIENSALVSKVNDIMRLHPAHHP